MRTVYKVFKRKGRSRLSFASVNLPKSLVVRYVLGKKVTAPLGELWVYLHKEDALHYIGKQETGNGVLVCHTTDQISRRHYRASLTKDRSLWYEEFWERTKNGTIMRQYVSGTCYAPPNSYTVKSLTPIKEIEL